MVWKLGMFAIQQECLRQRGTQAAGHRNANSRLQKKDRKSSCGVNVSDGTNRPHCQASSAIMFLYNIKFIKNDKKQG